MSLIFLSACQTSESVIFSNLCAAPCWRNIEPGKTTSSEALEMIRKFRDINSASIGVSGPWSIFSGFVQFTLQTGETIRVYSINDKASLITIYNLNGKLSFGKYVEELGMPEYATQTSVLGPGSPIIPASDAVHIWLFALNPKRGTVFGADVTDLDLTTETRVSYVRYFDPDVYLELLDNGFLVLTDSGHFSEDKLQIWKGYGNISKLYPRK